MRFIRQLVKRLQFHERWVLTAFLTVAVALPTVFFLYFFIRSLEGEGAIAGAAAAAEMRDCLARAQGQLDDYLANLPVLRTPPRESGLTASEKFAHAMERDEADSVLFTAEGQPLYPLISSYRDLNSVDQAALQFREEKRAAAAAHPGSRAPAMPAEWKEARDGSSRLILPSLQLQALQSPSLNAAERGRIQSSLKARALDYGPPLLPSAQRLFLVDEILKFEPDFHFGFGAAEALAIRVLERPLPALTPGVLISVPDVQARLDPPESCWLIQGEDGRIGVFAHDRIFGALEEKIQNDLLGEGLALRLSATKENRPSVLAYDSAGSRLPGFELHISRKVKIDEGRSRQRTQRAIASGAAVLAVIGLAGFFAIRRYLAVSRTTELRHDFLSTVSHELKTPLTSIRLLVETLGAGQYANPERTKQYVEVMQREIARLSHLVESFLTYTRLERGKLKFDFTETDPVQIAEHAVAIIGARFRGNCEFEVEIDNDLPLLEADSDTLITAVLNLLDNAHKYSPEKKHIIFRVYEQNHRVCFSVQDSGIGLSAADCRRVLQRYYRVDSTNTRGIQGAGLGLSIVKNVAEAHDGELTVQSELGKGSCFTVSIPVRNPVT